MAGDFNLFFISKLEAQGGNPTLKTNLQLNSLNLKRDMIYEIYEGKKYFLKISTVYFYIKTVFRFHSTEARLYINFEHS